MSLEKWDRRFLELAANEVAEWSKERQVTWGFNGFPRGVRDTPDRLDDKETKNKLTVHAELNALLNAGVDIVGWTLYVTKAPCLSCALAIIQKRIARVVSAPVIGTSSWSKSQWDGLAILKEAGVDTIYEGLQDG
jgi:dCMP deaminase